LKPEEELVMVKRIGPNLKESSHLHRFGFTQGSPLSPLLCAYALELGGIGSIEGLTMFADDGLILSETPIDVEEKLKSYLLKLSGVELAVDKPYGKTDKFKFLGLNYDLIHRVVTYEERLDENLEHLKGKGPGNTYVSAMINIDEYTEEDLDALVKYSHYTKEGIPQDKRTIEPLSMVRKVSWVEFYATR
jgi:hypothetical protein